jgi:hypothetical protein
MPAMRIILDAEGAFPEMKVLGDITAVARLAQGMQSGKDSVCFEFEVDGVKHYAQTSLVLLSTAVKAFVRTP